MRVIVSEFIGMFFVRESSKFEEMILKKCLLLLNSLINQQPSRWFELLAISTPTYQQKMQAETIQKLFEAYSISFYSSE